VRGAGALCANRLDLSVRGDFDEMMAAMCTGAALAKLVRGIVFEPHGGELQQLERAIAVGRKALDTYAKGENGTQ